MAIVEKRYFEFGDDSRRLVPVQLPTPARPKLHDREIRRKTQFDIAPPDKSSI